jgi:hypothetical protein
LDQQAKAPQDLQVAPPPLKAEPAPGRPLIQRTPKPRESAPEGEREGRFEPHPKRPPQIVAPPDVLPRIEPAEVIDLDLSARRQRAPLPFAPDARFTVLDIKGCDAPYEISPASGELTRRQSVAIRVTSRREIILRLSLAPGEDSLLLTIEPAVINAEGEEIPFYLTNIERIRTRVRKEGMRAADQLDALTAERQQLQMWINAPVAKPLAQRGQARRRVAELDNLIPPMQQMVQSLEQDMAIADAMDQIAQNLHQDCRIELGMPQADRGGRAARESIAPIGAE